MTLDDLIQASKARTASLRESAQGNPLMPVMGPSTQEEGNKPDKMAMLMALMQGGQSPGKGMDSLGNTYVGGSGDFNETHEGPGREGLTFGQSSQYTPMAQNLYELVSQRFPGVSMGGIQSNRNIAGTSTPSEHAYGAALDLMVGGNPLGDRIYKFLTRPRIANQYDYSNILWEVPDHYNHLHVGWLS